MFSHEPADVNDRRYRVDPLFNPDPEINIPSDDQRICHYTNPDDFHNKFKSASDNFSLIHFNCRSLNKNFDNLSLLLVKLGVKFGCIAVTETWLKDSYTTELYQLDSYSFVNKGRNHGNGGGVSLYVSDDIQYTVNNELSFFHENIFESVFIDLVDHPNQLSIGVVYRPPSCNLQTSPSALENILEKVGNHLC